MKIDRDVKFHLSIIFEKWHHSAE